MSAEDYWGRNYPDPIPPPELILELDYETLSSEDIDYMNKSCPSMVIQELIRIYKKYTCNCKRLHNEEEYKME